MEALFRQVGIYSHVGQRYEPVDKETLLYYKEATDGQILEEGITEAGSLGSFIAAGTAYATHGINTIPMFIFYSMFGFQRIGDLVWAAGDMRCRGFLFGGTAGRTTLAGEGLQHQDGHSHLLAYSHPHVVAYDPAYAYELATIVQHGIQRMYVEQHSVCYYLTVGNEPYSMPSMPDGAREGIINGAYLLRGTGRGKKRGRVKLLGSGAIMNPVLEAQTILKERHGIDSEAWTVTSYQQLSREGNRVDRENRLRPGKATPYVAQCFGGDDEQVVIAASDYSNTLPHSIRQWVSGTYVPLGTDGFGRSDGRAALRDYFEVDAPHIVHATLSALAERGELDAKELHKAMRELEIDPEKPNPMDF
jgi:pyruvate dehydrogenase E1 component